MSVLLLSGGIDSLVCLALEKEAGRTPLCLTVYYGQRNSEAEMLAANEICAHYGAPCIHLGIGALGGFFTGGLLDAAAAPPTPEQSVVPGRNMLLISLAAGLAAARGRRDVVIGCHAGDHAGYLDCRPPFIGWATSMTEYAYGVSVHAPLLGMSKKRVVEEGRRLGAPLELAWSCYVGGEAPCGECAACKSRREAGA